MRKIMTITQAKQFFRGALPDKIRFDMGKYEKTIVGRELPDDLITKAPIWAERRQDTDGPDWALYCQRR